MSDISSFVRYECDALYHDECVKIGVKSIIIIVVNYDEQIVDNRELRSLRVKRYLDNL